MRSFCCNVYKKRLSRVTKHMNGYRTKIGTCMHSRCGDNVRVCLGLSRMCRPNVSNRIKLKPKLEISRIKTFNGLDKVYVLYILSGKTTIIWDRVLHETSTDKKQSTPHQSPKPINSFNTLRICNKQLHSSTSLPTYLLAWIYRLDVHVYPSSSIYLPTIVRNAYCN